MRPYACKTTSWQSAGPIPCFIAHRCFVVYSQLPGPQTTIPGGSIVKKTLAVMALLLLAATALPAQQSLSSASSTPALDYAFFKQKVQPIFLKKRPGHARCVVCHDHRVPPLQPLAPGAANWNEEQSRQNFEMWKLFVVPGEPLQSKMLLHPLAKKAGGDNFHAGGKHFQSQSDPEWQTLAAWVLGQTIGGSK